MAATDTVHPDSAVLEAIADHEGDDPAPIEDVLQTAAETVDAEAAAGAFAELERLGEIYRPADGRVRRTPEWGGR